MNLAATSFADVDVRYRALADVAGALASYSELDDLFLSLRSHLEPLIRFEFLAVSLRDRDDGSLVLRFFEPQDLPVHHLLGSRYPIDDSYPGQAVQTGIPVYVPQVEEDGPYPSAILAEYGVQSYCAVPLTTARRVVGSLNFGSAERDAYSPEEVALMARVARIVAVAVENALNLEKVREQRAALQRERDQLDLILQLNNAVVTQLDTEALFRSIAPALRRFCRADLASLTVQDPVSGALRTRVCDGDRVDPTRREGIECDPDASPTGLVVKDGVPRVFTREELIAYPITKPLVVDHGMQSACAVPLVTAKGIIGTLNLAAAEPNAFSEPQIQLLTRVAAQVAIALSNAMAYEQIEELNAQLAREKVYLEDEIRSEQLFEDIIGTSAALRQVMREVETVAPTDSTVLILGETGAGKELVARAIHQLGARRDQAFVRLNCAAIPTGLLESELFGHEKGAFTGAIAQRIGRFELANRGTVFLDEIGEIPLELQPKLLRVLQEREFERLGSARTLRTDARLIAATNRDLAALVEEQKFRQDLFYRLNVFPIRVPPLRERREDIPVLVRHFAQQFARRMKKRIDAIPAETMDVLIAYDWPGNVRELQNLIERAVILSHGPTLEVPVTTLAPRLATPAASRQPQTLEETDRRHIVAALESTNWVIGGPRGAATRLGMKRSTLQFRMRKLGIERPAAAAR